MQFRNNSILKIFFLIIFLFNINYYSFSLQDSTLNQNEEIDFANMLEIKTENEIEEFDNFLTINPSVIYKTSQVQKGIEISNGNPTLGFGFDISHSFGFSLLFSNSNTINNGINFLNNNFGLSYEYEFNDYFSGELSYSKTFFNDEIINPIASASNSLGICFDFFIPHFIFDLSYNHSFGTSTINDIGLSLISYFKIGENFKITPSLILSLTNYKISTKKINKTLKIFGLSSVVANLKLTYKFLDNLGIFITPAFSFTPNKDLSIKKFQTLLSIGLDYDFDIIL